MTTRIFNLAMIEKLYMGVVTCWICGSTKKVTKHHVIPKRFKPLKNALMPLCYNCHQSLERSYHTYKT